MTDNGIGDEGAETLSEMLKVNTTLTKLHLQSDTKINSREREMDGKSE